MAGIPHPWFDWDNSIPDFLVQLRLDLQNQGIDLAGAGANGRAQAKGYLRSCMRGRTLEWFDKEITTKTNWELTNLTDGTGQANLVAINGRTAIQIGVAYARILTPTPIFLRLAPNFCSTKICHGH